MSKIQEKITAVMDEIQALMESHPRAHLEPDTKIHELMGRAGMYFALWTMKIDTIINLFKWLLKKRRNGTYE